MGWLVVESICMPRLFDLMSARKWDEVAPAERVLWKIWHRCETWEDAARRLAEVKAAHAGPDGRCTFLSHRRRGR
jgi:hypothetical protein